ncbi:MAG: hypothetical protein ABFS86_19525, partial [Planctomycetota bacterium]
ADVGRAVARAALLGEEEVDPADPTALTVRMYRKARDPAEKGRFLEEVLRQAGDGEAARAETVAIAGDLTQPPLFRMRALAAANRVGAMTAEELVALFEGAPDREFREALRRELKKRTGKDGKLDPAAWRKILAE